MFQRIQHPWKDKIFGTNPPTVTKAPIYYCTHQIYPTGANRGNHHGSPSVFQMKPYLIRKLKNQITVKVLINSKKDKNNLVENTKIDGPVTSVPSILKGSEPNINNPFLHDEIPHYNLHHPWIHYEVGENNHFESFGKLEHGLPEPERSKPKLYYFNPLIYRSRFANFISNHQKHNFNTKPQTGGNKDDDKNGKNMISSYCEWCRRPYQINKAETNNNNMLTNIPLKRKYLWLDRLRNIRKTLLDHIKPHKSPRNIEMYKRAYVDFVSKLLRMDNSPLAPILKSPKYLEIIKKLASHSLDKTPFHLLEPPSAKYSYNPTNVPLLPYYKDK